MNVIMDATPSLRSGASTITIASVPAAEEEPDMLGVTLSLTKKLGTGVAFSVGEVKTEIQACRE